MATLTVRIDDTLETELNELATRRGMSRSDVVRDILRRRLALERFWELRRKLVPYAEAAGYFTDEDIFRDFS